MTSCAEVSWQLDGITMRSTLTHPDGHGPFPAVVLARSGPRPDWCSPLLPGTNGSGRLFAEALAAAGIASLRYDKRASGPDAAESARALFGKLSMRSHLGIMWHAECAPRAAARVPPSCAPRCHGPYLVGPRRATAPAIVSCSFASTVSINVPPKRGGFAGSRR